MRCNRWTAIIALAALTLGGCAAGPWDHYWVPNPIPAELELTEREHVEIRVVSPEQARQAARMSEAYLEEQATAPEDITAEQARAVRQILLDALLIREDAATITNLGQSGFIGPAPAQRNDPTLESFAKRRGADIAVLLTEYLGETQGSRMVPVGMATSSTRGNATAYGYAWDNQGWWANAYGSASSSAQSNTVVYGSEPVTYHHYGSSVLLLRRCTIEERSLIDSSYKSR